LGVCYKNKQQFDSSAWYYSNAIQKAEQAQNWRMYYSLHDNMAELYASQQKNKIALSYYLKAINRPEGIAGNPKSDISTFANIANLYLQQNDILNALHYAALGKKLIQKYPQIEVFAADLFYTEAVSYFMQGDKTAGMQSMNKYKQVSDSIFSEKNATALAQYEAKYEIAEKNKLLLEQEILLQQQKISMQRITIALLVILAGIIALAGYFFYAFKKKQQDAKQAELYLALAKQKEITQLQEERLRISRELHDNIGSHLTLISATAEHIENTASNEKVEGLKNMLRKTTQELRKTVWLLNKQRITIDEVIIKLREYLKPLQHSDCKVEINYNGDGQVMLSDIQTTQLFRIIQEAVNNAIKYASCSIIQIELNIDEYKIMSFSIKDNGTGFDPERTPKGGGIRNMNYRIGLLNGALTLSSTKNEGTVIVGSFNI
jgi:signal transduction histidine kinase